MITKHREILYLLLSIYILIQATLFPEKPAEFLIYIFQPKLDGRSVFFSPYDHARYLNIIVYIGLALSGAFFFNAAKLSFKYFLKRKERIIKFIDIATSLATITLVFLCTVKVYHLFQGENVGLFSPSGETAATLAVLLVCVVFNFFRKRKNNLRNNLHNQNNIK